MATSFNPDTSPPSFKNHLIRSSLLRLIDAQNKKLTLIQAPPGYGKTSFLKQVYDHLECPHIWMNLRQSDNDPINFLHKWNSALAQLSNTKTEASDFSHTNGFTSPSTELWTRSLIDHINKQTHLAIFLNDADFVHASESMELISLLLQMSHSGIRIFITASSHLHFSYSHLLIENQLANISQESLRFSKEDIQAIFKLHTKIVPEDTLSKQLADVSEGWPAAAFYMASSLQSEDQLKLFIEDNNVYSVTKDKDGDLVKNKKHEVLQTRGYGEQLNYFWMNKGGVWTETQIYSISWTSDEKLSVYFMRHVSNKTADKKGNTDWGYFAKGVLE